MADERYRVLLLPGGVLPAAPAYGALLEALGGRVDAVLKDLEVYAGEQPAAGFGLEREVAAIGKAADEHGFGRFHLVGYSAGGACSVAFAAANRERLASLVLLEPAWAGNERTAEEDGLQEHMREARTRPPAEFMAAFVRLQLAPGVDPAPPPEGPPPPWMARRPEACVP
jgi:pimeloyl-ACP methyl ester carboxylesterase